VIGWISDVAKWVISSVSPLGEAILWKKEWEESSFLVWNKKTNVKILKILQS
jgi:transcription elongation GreA/GreB family factor